MARFTATGGSGDGTPGAPGADGADGQDGADALWNYTGEYSGGAAYAVGDIVTYDGQLWYRYNANGGNVGDTPSPGLWNLLAAKGADGTDATGGVVYLGNYVSGNGYITNIAVVRGSDNNLYIAKSSGGLGDPVGNTAEWDIFSENGAGTNTGDITFNGIQIIGAGTASGDGSNLGTIELVPDGNITSDQYVIIDPTAPNHIHIRAGGTQDASAADLFIGAERNNVRVSDSYNNVTVNTRPDPVVNTYANSNEASNAEFIHASGADIVVGDTVRLYTGGDSYTVTTVTPEYPYEGLMTVLSDGLSFITGEAYTFTREQSPNLWTFEEDGVLYGPAMGGIKVLGLINSGNNDLGLYANDADIVLQAGSGAVNIVAPEVNFTSNAVPASVNINTYSGAVINSSRTSTYAPEDKVVATLGDLPTGVTGSFTIGNQTFNITNGIITSIDVNI